MSAEHLIEKVVIVKYRSPDGGIYDTYAEAANACYMDELVEYVDSRSVYSRPRSELREVFELILVEHDIVKRKP